MKVLVTTDNRGVFYGDLTEANNQSPEKIKLTQARNCVYWSKAMKGFLGLAADGPNEECRVGPEVPSIELYGITSITEVTEAAQTAWDAAPWGDPRA